MQIETLKVFRDLADTGSFSEAAERNFITQSAVSQQLRTLEDKFKCRLIERLRGRRELLLTGPGETFYEESQKVLQAHERLEERMRGDSYGLSGRVHVGTVYSVGMHELPPKVRRFVALYPSVKLDIEYSRTTRITRDVIAGALDIGIIAYPGTRRGLTTVNLPGDRLVLIAKPDDPISKRKTVKPAELQDRPFVVFERDIPTRRATDRILKTYGVTVQVVAEFDNIETIKRAVEVGLGLAIVPRPSILDEERTGQLVALRLAGDDWHRPVGIIYRSDRPPSRAAHKFIELLTDLK